MAMMIGKFIVALVFLCSASKLCSHFCSPPSAFLLRQVVSLFSILSSQTSSCFLIVQVEMSAPSDDFKLISDGANFVVRLGRALRKDEFRCKLYQLELDEEEVSLRPFDRDRELVPRLDNNPRRCAKPRRRSRRGFASGGSW